MSRTTKAPKRQRFPKDMVGLTLPEGALVMVDSLVGTFFGSTRSEVLRFIVVSWICENRALVAKPTARQEG